MKKIFFLLLILSSCKADKHTGYVYDINQKPLKGVMVYDLISREKVFTDSTGHFELPKPKDVSSKLVFEKKDFSTDTISSVRIQNGEQQTERFNGEIIHLFKKDYKDSILRINGIK